MKTYNLSDNRIIQIAMRHYVNYQAIPNVDQFMDELERLLAKISYYEDMELKYADLLEENHELRKLCQAGSHSESNGKEMSKKL